MLGRVRSVLQLMGHGLACQDLEEMSPSDYKLRQIEQRSRNYRLSGGQSRIVLIAGTDAQGPAFDFVVDLAGHTKSLIEVLYVGSRDGEESRSRELIHRLGDLGCDFQMSFLTGNLLERVADYNAQRQDIMAVVCSSKEAFADNIRSAYGSLEAARRFGFPALMLVGGSLLA